MQDAKRIRSLSLFASRACTPCTKITYKSTDAKSSRGRCIKYAGGNTDIK